MKTLKLGLVAVLLAVTAMAYSINDKAERPVKRCVKISIENVGYSSGLVKAIYQQVDPSFLGNDAFRLEYSAHVRYRDRMYQVYGTYKQWMDFMFQENSGGVLTRERNND